MRICSIECCENEIYSKGYCQKHYTRVWKYGNPLHVERERHGMIETPEYRTWKNMKDRCYNKNNKRYHRYGGRGIIVCDRWLHSFANFFADMGKRPFLKAQIDRINNDGNYEPGNCKWATNAENNQHTSRNKLTMAKAKEIRIKYKTGKITMKKLSLIFDTDSGTISDIVHQKIWRALC